MSALDDIKARAAERRKLHKVTQQPSWMYVEQAEADLDRAIAIAEKQHRVMGEWLITQGIKPHPDDGDQDMVDAYLERVERFRSDLLELSKMNHELEKARAAALTLRDAYTEHWVKNPHNPVPDIIDAVQKFMADTEWLEEHR